MTSQRRRTAGIRVIQGITQVHIDPGPGALVFSNWANLSPEKLDGLIVTHCHPDHYTDAEVFIEAMTRGTTANRGVLASTKSVLRGSDGIGPSISKYHQGQVGEIIELEEGTNFNISDLRFTATEATHSDPDSVGLRIRTPNGDIGYTSDTGYFPELSDNYAGTRLLILCTMWPRGKHLNIHLNTDEALSLIEEINPEACIITHFGMRMLNAGPEKEAKYLYDMSSVPVFAASDGLNVRISDNITLKGSRKKDEEIVIEN